MAEEAEEDAGGGSGGGDGGSLLKKYGPLAAIVLLAQVVLAWVLVEFGLSSNVKEEDTQLLVPDTPTVEVYSGGDKGEMTQLPFYYSKEEFKTITANPAGTNSERFVVVSVQLGLLIYDADGEDVTEVFNKEETEVLSKAPLKQLLKYDNRIISVVNKTLRLKTVDQLQGEFIQDTEDEIRDKLNNEIFYRLFPADDDDKTKVEVSEVDFLNIIIQ